MMENKINNIKKPMPPEWWKFLKKLQNDRIKADTETSQTKISLPKLMILIMNFFIANEKFYKAIVDAEYYKDKNKLGKNRWQ